MLAVLIGITPPIQSHEELIVVLKEKNKECNNTSTSIQWLVDDGTGWIVVKDPETNDATLLIQAIIQNEKQDGEVSVTPEDVVQVMQNCLVDSYFSSSCHVSIWATAPAILPLKPMGDYLPSQISLEEDGIQFQTNILSQAHVDDFVSVVEEAIETTELLIQQHRPSITLGESTFAFQEICARSPYRFDLRLDHTRAICLAHEYILTQPHIQQQLLKWLHCNDIKEIDFDVSVVYSKPGAKDQAWHTDGHAIENKGRYAVCLFLPLIDLSQETGFTQFWPRSQVSSQLLGFGPVAELTQSTVDGICNKGGGVWYDYQVWHRGMANHSNQLRPVLQVIFKQAWYVERDNYGTESIIPKGKCL